MSEAIDNEKEQSANCATINFPANNFLFQWIEISATFVDVDVDADVDADERYEKSRNRFKQRQFFWFAAVSNLNFGQIFYFHFLFVFTIEWLISVVDQINHEKS